MENDVPNHSESWEELNIVDINIPPPATTKTWKFEAKKSAEISHLNQTFQIDRNMRTIITTKYLRWFLLFVGW